MFLLFYQGRRIFLCWRYKNRSCKIISSFLNLF
jgi:hypothetical protein